MYYKKPRRGILQRIGFRHHEYWPWWVLVAPIWPLWVWYMIRTRNLTWFTAVNPGMEDSGFLGESKIKILDAIPTKYKPKTIFIDHTQRLDAFTNLLAFPFIAKPDIGGRGRKIKTIESFNAWMDYHQHIAEDYMIQEIVPYELELGVFYIRMPWQTRGEIVSVSQKEFLSVTGDGKNSLLQLMTNDYRASRQIQRLQKNMNLDEVLAQDEIRVLEPIGNHCRGTIFRDHGYLITPELTAVFDEICSHIDGFYYGRFDLRVKSIDDLLKGQHIQILELNGLTSDPAHIFDPNARLRDAFRVQWNNCKKSYQIAAYHLKNGVKTTPVFELYRKSKKSFV